MTPKPNRPTPNIVNGWLVLNKPLGVTSAKAVAIVKRSLNVKKIGHAGTLDPLASGVLPLALGEATKTVSFMMDATKEYEFTVEWGKATTTDDAEGQVIATSDIVPTKEHIISVLPQFTGAIMQVPPAFSAIKVQGMRSYDLARQGEAVALQSRLVQVYSLKLLDVPSHNQAVFHVHCGKGTYVRSLARDIARALGTYGYVTRLVRTRVGQFGLNNAILLETIERSLYKEHALGTMGLLQPVERVLDDIPVLRFTPEEARMLRHGQTVPVVTQLPDGATVAVHSENILLAIAKVRAGFVEPVRVFNL